MTSLSTLKAANASRWARAKFTRSSEFLPVAKRLLKEKTTYQRVEKSTGVPWFVVAVIHEREASGDFSRSLAQGDPWTRVSTHVPKGRGPFGSFYAAAEDALKNCAPYAAKNTDWSVGGTLTILEQYNGLGYASRGLPSPYIWSGTDQYVKGKYVRDGVFDPNEVDEQLGCAGLILQMQALDPSIRFEGAQASGSSPVVRSPTNPAPNAPAQNPAPQASPEPSKGFFGFLLGLLSFFKRKPDVR